MPAPQIHAGDGPPDWRIIIANDTCPDVTWGFTEAQVRQAFADLIGAHLDEMNRTDALAPEDRDHYNATAFIEVESFLEKYPQRQAEMLRRIAEGRLCVSPFLCNSLWGFQSVEGALRTFYPARRMERKHGMPIDIAEHIELPSLPWGMATLMAGCGIRWTSVPFMDYDTTFKGLNNPPLFRLEGPDGSEARARLDAWASLKTSYYQGGYLLKDPRRVTSEWIPHYAGLGAAYPLRTIFASGTHSDINPNSHKQARGFADGIISYNAAGTNGVKLVNGTLAQFCAEVDAVEAASPFLPKLRGDFGQSWQLWPVSLARTVAEEREKAEWFWAMLSDHAWNGADPKNKRHNAELRRYWADRFGDISQRLTGEAWDALGFKAESRHVTVFNPLSFTRDILVECAVPVEVTGLKGRASQFRSQGSQRNLVFVVTEVPAFGFREYAFETNVLRATVPPFSVTATTLEGPFYRLRVDLTNGGLASLVHKASGQELLNEGSARSLCQTVFNNGQERQFSDVKCQTQLGPVCGEMRVTGRIGDLRVTNVITLFTALDRVDFDVRLEKPPTANEQRLLHFFPIGQGVRDLRIETTAVVLRPQLQPDGDLRSEEHTSELQSPMYLV